MSPRGNKLPEMCDGATTTGARELSEATGSSQVAGPASSPGDMDALTFGGHVICGGSVSPTTTAKRHELMLPDESEAVMVTTFEPMGSRLVPTTAEEEVLRVLPELSRSEGGSHCAGAVGFPDSVETVRFLGQMITGGSSSITVTTKVHDAELPKMSVAVYRTVFFPIGKVLSPELKLLERLTCSPLLSDTVGPLQSAVPVLAPSSVVISILPGQVMRGVSLSFTVMRSLQESTLPLPSEAVKVTIVVPIGNPVPLFTDPTTATG